MNKGINEAAKEMITGCNKVMMELLIEEEERRKIPYVYVPVEAEEVDEKEAKVLRKIKQQLGASHARLKLDSRWDRDDEGWAERNAIEAILEEMGYKWHIERMDWMENIYFTKNGKRITINDEQEVLDRKKEIELKVKRECRG